MGFVLCLWLSLVFISSWAGANFVAKRGGERTATLVLHIITGILSLPVFMILIWYPQRMLGGVRLLLWLQKKQTRMEGTPVLNESDSSNCPECDASVPIFRTRDGKISIPCSTIGCNQKFHWRTYKSCSAKTQLDMIVLSAELTLQ